MKTKKWQCKECSAVFKADERSVVARCPNCNSVKTKKVSLTPTKTYIKVFNLYETKKCRECGRPLRSEHSMKRGFGATCGAYYAEKWFDNHPTDMGERAKKRWTPEEVEALIKFAHTRKAGE